METLDALKTLDPTKDEHWTNDGLPSLAALKPMLGKVKRSEVTEAAPDFCRQALIDAESDDTDSGADTTDGNGQDAQESDFDDMSWDEKKALAEARKAELQAERDAIAAEQKELAAADKAISDEMDAINKHLDEDEFGDDPPHIRETKKRMRHLNREAENRAARKRGARAKFEGAPGSVMDLALKSPLDQHLGTRAKQVTPLMSANKKPD